MSKFDENVRYTKSFYCHKFECKLGLWSVECKTKEDAEREARYYFMQYDADGEYDGTEQEKLIAKVKQLKEKENESGRVV